MARILVVEDNPQNLELATVILRAAGHDVVPARDAGEAEVALSKQLPALIVMDIALPGKDGYAIVRELRQRAGTAGLPVLAVSSFAMPGDAERAFAAGVSDYLTKPIRRAILLERVNALLPPTPRPASKPSGSAPSSAVATAPGPPNDPAPESVDSGDAATAAPASEDRA